MSRSYQRFVKWWESFGDENGSYEETGEELAEVAFDAGFDAGNSHDDEIGKFDFMRERELETSKEIADLKAENEKLIENQCDISGQELCKASKNSDLAMALMNAIEGRDKFKNAFRSATVLLSEIANNETHLTQNPYLCEDFLDKNDKILHEDKDE